MNDSNNRFTLTTTPRKNFFLMAALTLWLALWGGGLVVVAGALLRGQVKETGFFVVFILLAWLAGWSVGGGLALYGLLWTGCGIETIVATSTEVTITRNICGYQRVRRYEATKIRSLRLAELKGGTDFLFSLRPFGMGNGLLTFDCGSSVVSCAEGIDPLQAKNFLTELRAVLSPHQEAAHV